MEYTEWKRINIIDELRLRIMVAKDKSDFAKVREFQQKMDLQLEKNEIK